MNRREYVTKGAAAAGLLFAAGCSGSSSGNTGATEPTESTETATTSTTEHIELASEAMEKAGDELAEESEKFSSSEFSDGGVDIRTATTTEYLDTAERHLDAAKPDATAEQRDWIELARSWIEVARDLIGFLDTFAEGYSQANAGFTYLQSERYTDAEEQLVTAEETTSESNEQLTLTQNSLDEFDESELDDVEAVSITKIEDALNQLDALVPAVTALTQGMKHFSRGMIDYEEARSAYDSEEYNTAEMKYRDAANDFNTAHSILREQEDAAPQSMKATFIDLTCRAGALRDGSQHLAEAITAVQDRDSARAEEEAAKAEEAFGRCGSNQN